MNPNNPTRLIYLMDPMCSWCWGFAPVFAALAKQAQAADIPVYLVAGGLRAGQQEPIDSKMRDYILGHWKEVQKRSGQPFNFGGALREGFVYDTEPACRALICAKTLDNARTLAFVLRMQQAFYVEGRDIVKPQVLVELAEEVGFKRSSFAKSYDSDKTEQALLADFTFAQNLGISGFPTVLAERAGSLALLTNGFAPLEALAPLLSRWLTHAANAG
ncbi:disulfide bond formation protein DsbA [Ventosimonas gracilis]|uniref:Disulfide bond formation protein DsbA n=1 Tax=Ventosimonas gracilis TaxID=1680762 RepID=A0A139SMD2_9GAMM|nr:DsbA family protein [Ventosimonas gracilis]KXU35746.1 disulfide bond formation protein DsbA [Ventosimonas gracilis]